ncbi:ribosomal protein L24 [Allomyces macrogynus ATCC 38327]|uniref:Ribosomal protein L24 n=1 Tax=Allomyces macrogynus (strain ATCC 38327) TaxID=578462 RepID=A0A0L0RY56_ALLM3|nr:ribosomal protein L24 [Allomyces macrogynus ATCC 38327]|eukprot:KNE55014.1 ribosomal protein L24 [Allomyces macrogynus ATCC 38327]
MSKFHKLVSPPVNKIKGINMIQAKLPKVQYKDRVPAAKWNLYKGDEVIVISGKDKGQKGKIIDMDREKMLVYVKDLKTVKKHVPKTPQTPSGGLFPMETGIHMSNVALIDPKDGMPCRVRWEKEKDQMTGQLVRRRISKRSGIDIPKPVFDPALLDEKRKKDNPVDTLAEAVKEQTFFPLLNSPPVPGDLRLKGHGLW